MAQQILVIILSSALAIFLILAIVSIIMVIQLIKKMQLVAQKAERIVDSVESVGDVLKKAAGPLGLFKLVRGFADMVGQHKQDNEDK